MPGPELLAYLLAAVVKLSGYPAVALEDLPPIVTLPPEHLAEKLCKERRDDCGTMVSAFVANEYVIYVRDDLDLESAADNSFLVHELVHVLQYRRDGPAMFENCERSLRTEREAYRVQNLYLWREGTLMRVGRGLDGTNCSENPAAFFAREPRR